MKERLIPVIILGLLSFFCFYTVYSGTDKDINNLAEKVGIISVIAAFGFLARALLKRSEVSHS